MYLNVPQGNCAPFSNMYDPYSMGMSGLYGCNPMGMGYPMVGPSVFGGQSPESKRTDITTFGSSAENSNVADLAKGLGIAALAVATAFLLKKAPKTASAVTEKEAGFFKRGWQKIKNGLESLKDKCRKNNDYEIIEMNNQGNVKQRAKNINKIRKQRIKQEEQDIANAATVARKAAKKRAKGQTVQTAAPAAPVTPAPAAATTTTAPTVAPTVAQTTTPAAAPKANKPNIFKRAFNRLFGKNIANTNPANPGTNTASTPVATATNKRTIYKQAYNKVLNKNAANTAQVNPATNNITAPAATEATKPSLIFNATKKAADDNVQYGIDFAKSKAQNAPTPAIIQAQTAPKPAKTAQADTNYILNASKKAADDNVQYGINFAKSKAQKTSAPAETVTTTAPIATAEESVTKATATPEVKAEVKPEVKAEVKAQITQEAAPAATAQTNKQITQEIIHKNGTQTINTQNGSVQLKVKNGQVVGVKFKK